MDPRECQENDEKQRSTNDDGSVEGLIWVAHGKVFLGALRQKCSAVDLLELPLQSSAADSKKFGGMSPVVP